MNKKDSYWIDITSLGDPNATIDEELTITNDYIVFQVDGVDYTLEEMRLIIEKAKCYDR